MYQQLLSLGALLATTASARPASLNTRQSTSTCASGVHIIGASGDGEANIGGYGLLESLVTSIVNAIPGSDNVTLPYPKADPNGLYKTTVGGQTDVQYITDYAASCPDTKIVLLGYSAGGIITLNALCGASAPWTSPAGPIDTALLPNILGTIIYGDETHTSLSPFNAGTCTGNGRFPRSGESALCPASAATIRSYCNADDPQCCSGFIPDAHFSYPADYDADATAYIVSLYEQNPSVGGAVASSSVAAPASTPVEASSPVVVPASSPSATSTTTVELTSTVVVTPMSTVPVTTVQVYSADAPATSAAAPASAAPVVTSAPAAPAAPAAPQGEDNSPSTPAPAAPEATITTPEPATTNCPVNLHGDFEFPHLIVPIDETEPDTAFGTSYNGKVSNTVSSIFNFDIPAEDAGKQCTLVFMFPEQADLTWSSFTVSGNGGINVASLEAPADLDTSFANAPAEAKNLGTYSILPGGAKAFQTIDCPAGERIGYKLSATGDYALDYFQAQGDSPIGLYIRTCSA